MSVQISVPVRINDGVDIIIALSDSIESVSKNEPGVSRLLISGPYITPVGKYA